VVHRTSACDAAQCSFVLPPAVAKATTMDAMMVSNFFIVESFAQWTLTGVWTFTGLCMVTPFLFAGWIE